MKLTMTNHVLTAALLLAASGVNAFISVQKPPPSSVGIATPGVGQRYTTTSYPPPALSNTALHIIPSRMRLRDLEWKKPEDWQVEEWLKKYGEVSRYYRRDVFTAGDWVRARRPNRFFESIKNTLKSGLLRQIKHEIACVSAIALFAVLYNNILIHKLTAWSFLTPSIKNILPSSLQLPLVPFQLAAASLGLLLTFRTNVSYQRWNEARTAWGKVINDSRSLARMASVWSTCYNRNVNPALLQKLGEAICSFSRTLMNRTLPQQEDETNFQLYCLKQLTDKQYGQSLLQAGHRPTRALAEITQTLTLFKFHPLYHVEMEKLVTELCSAMGACERIFTSPVPTFYPRHTVRFLAVWLFFLPFALYTAIPSFRLIPIITCIAGFMLGIEELANQMEEPFSILPMEKMCQNSIQKPIIEQLQRSVMDMQAMSGVPPPQEQYPNVNSGLFGRPTLQNKRSNVPTPTNNPSIPVNGSSGKMMTDTPTAGSQRVSATIAIDGSSNSDAASVEVVDESEMLQGATINGASAEDEVNFQI